MTTLVTQGMKRCRVLRVQKRGERLLDTAIARAPARFSRHRHRRPLPHRRRRSRRRHRPRCRSSRRCSCYRRSRPSNSSLRLNRP
jgi:hypothetical protein